MISRPDPVQPPRTAAWLVNLFAPAGQADAITGDLIEEFSQIAAESGVEPAQRWYWRQTLATVVHLIAAAYRTAPWTITGVAIGGFLVRWLFSWWSDPLVHTAIEGVLDRYRVYELDPHAYIFWFTNSMMVERLIVNLLIGGLVAMVASGREMTAAVTLALLGDVLAIQATWMTFATTGDHGILWTLPWSFAFSVAVIVGGALVRMRRSATSTPPSVA